MNNLWSDADAEVMVAAYAGKGINRDLALRTYTTRPTWWRSAPGPAWRRQHIGQD
jgi:hypothetical protein